MFKYYDRVLHLPDDKITNVRYELSTYTGR